mgnify:CR=1 FL=1
MDTTKLKFSIIPGKTRFNSFDPKLHNQVYTFWKEFWTDLFEKNGAQPPRNYQFILQDYFNVLTFENDVVGFSSHLLIDLESVADRDQEYLVDYFPEIFLSKLKERGVRYCMSIGNLTANASYQGKQKGLSVGALLAALATHLLSYCQADALMGPTRTDNGMDQLFSVYGAVAETPEYDLFGTPCKGMVLYRENIKPNHKHNVNNLAIQLWNAREVFVDLERVPNFGLDKKAG